jgi:flagellar hook-associated protein 1 FlgK
MASIFNSLNIGYSGLNASQIAIDTTSNNITNAEVEGYTRQRVITSASTPVSSGNVQVGDGTSVDNVSRIFDNYVFDRYKSISADKEYSDYEQKKLEELSTYFPEVDGVGVKSDLSDYYDMWQTFSDNPDNDSVKISLAEQTTALSKHISSTQDKVLVEQQQLNDELKINVDEVNSLASELADINSSIDASESSTGYTANELRDRRNTIENDLSRLIGAEVTSDTLTSDIGVDSSSNLKTGSYTLSVNGFNIVDGSTYHPIKLTNDSNPYGFYSVSYERQDGTLIPMEEDIDGGRIGSILDLRGGTIDNTSHVPVDGVLQNTVAELDAFANGLIESTNNIYAQSSQINMQSNAVDVPDDQPLVNSDLNINEGAFTLIVYDVDGNEVSSRDIKIDNETVLSGDAGTNSIEGQMSDDIDDNENESATDDVDDYLNFSYKAAASGEQRLEFTMDPEAAADGYTFAIKDVLPDDSYASGTNFAGAFGMSRFFDGDDASSISLSQEFEDNPTLISAGAAPVSGDNTVALDMVQQQYEKYDFDVAGQKYNSTIYGMFDITATDVGTATNTAILKNETVTTQFNATELEYANVSQVNVDEEMTNLIKYQTSYGAAAKIITTIDQMMDTLLGIKR